MYGVFDNFKIDKKKKKSDHFSFDYLDKMFMLLLYLFVILKIG